MASDAIEKFDARAWAEADQALSAASAPLQSLRETIARERTDDEIAANRLSVALDQLRRIPDTVPVTRSELLRCVELLRAR